MLSLGPDIPGEKAPGFSADGGAPGVLQPGPFPLLASWLFGSPVVPIRLSAVHGSMAICPKTSGKKLVKSCVSV